MRLKILFLIIFYSLSIGHLLAIKEDNAIARIYAATSFGKCQSGTGFFVKIGGRPYIVTAYHVIYGSNKLDIKSSDGDLTDISVAAYDEKKDLALINFKTTKSKSNIDYFTLTESLPENLTSISGHIIGHPNTLTYAHIPITFIKNQYINSDELSCFIFGRKLNLLGLNGTIYGGVSGAPVIISTGVVGLISGSFNEGGAITWAIPSCYILRMNILPVPILNLNSLPPLNMMAKAFNKLTRDFEIASEVREDYISFSVVNSAFKAHNLEYAAAIADILAVCNSFKSAIGGCDTYEKFASQYGSFDARFSRVRTDVDAFEKRNNKDVVKWRAILVNLKNNANQEEYNKYLTTNGYFINPQIDLIESQLAKNNLERDQVHKEIPGILAALEDAGKRNDYSLLKPTAYKWIDNLIQGYGYIRSMLFSQNEIIELNEILENAMVECREYQ